MIEGGWLGELSARVRAECARVESAVARLQSERQRLSMELDTVLDRVGRASDARERAMTEELHERVLLAFQEQRFASLTLREQRYAAKRFETFEPHQMQAFLSTHPANWDMFAKECFRRWDELTELPTQFAYYRLLCLAPGSVRFLHDRLRLPDLVANTGPATLAKTLDAFTLGEARKELQQRGWEPGWAYTSITLAMWARMFVDRGSYFDTLWYEIAADTALEATLLPRRADGLQSWFSDAPRSARIRACVPAQAVFVSALLRAACRGGVDATNWNVFCDGLLRSEFRDPRMPPESTGWARLKQSDKESFQFFLELLISEDLEVFFDHAMNDRRRREFWLRYLKSLRRTTCILDGSTYDRLKRQLSGAERKMAAAILRAHQFTTRGGAASAQAFCLYFDNVVIVEFSEKGNAAYVYDRDVFEKLFERQIRDHQLRDHHKLKATNFCRDRIIHNSSGWEQNTARALRYLGIYPDT